MKMLIIGIESALPEILLGEESLENVRRLLEYGCYGRLAGVDVQSSEAAWYSLLSSRPAEQLIASGLDFSQPELLPDGSQTGGWVWSPIRAQGKPAHILVDSASSEAGSPQQPDSGYPLRQAIFNQARALMHGNDWEFLLLIDRGLAPLHQAELAGSWDQEGVRAYYNHLNAQIGTLLELLDDETLVLVVSLVGGSSETGTIGAYILASSNNPLNGEISDVSLLEIAPTLLELSGYKIPESMQGKSIIAGKATQRLSWGDLSAEEEEILRERLSGLGYIS